MTLNENIEVVYDYYFLQPIDVAKVQYYGFKKYYFQNNRVK